MPEYFYFSTYAYPYRLLIGNDECDRKITGIIV